MSHSADYDAHDGKRCVEHGIPGCLRAHPVENDALREAKAEGWDSAVQAVAWCLDNGEPSAFAALAYVAENNPHRVIPPAETEGDQ